MLGHRHAIPVLLTALVTTLLLTSGVGTGGRPPSLSRVFAAQSAPRAPDVVILRSGERRIGRVASIDERSVWIEGISVPRDVVKLVAFASTDAAQPQLDPVSLDIVVLAQGVQLAGRVLAMTREVVSLATGVATTWRSMPLDQVVAIAFCQPASCEPLPSTGAGGPSSGLTAAPPAPYTPGPIPPTYLTPQPSMVAAGPSAPLPTVTLPQASATMGPVGADACHEDERMSFSPTEPRVGNELLIAVTSAGPHPYPRLTGTEPPTFVRNRPGQQGYVWEWTVRLTWWGEQEYVFYVDSTVRCLSGTIQVGKAIATPTPKPIRIR